VAWPVRRRAVRCTTAARLIVGALQVVVESKAIVGASSVVAEGTVVKSGQVGLQRSHACVRACAH
jgi:hypothetical protein